LIEDVVHVLLRVAIEQREPAALHLHHDPVTRFEGVQHIL
jgi:hypothetical protein